jgi:hypothetical protein
MQHETITEWDEPPGPTKMWLLFQAPDGELQTAPQGFTIRRAFKINLRRAFQVWRLYQECARDVPGITRHHRSAAGTPTA